MPCLPTTSHCDQPTDCGEVMAGGWQRGETPHATSQWQVRPQQCSQPGGPNHGEPSRSGSACWGGEAGDASSRRDSVGAASPCYHAVLRGARLAVGWRGPSYVQLVWPRGMSHTDGETGRSRAFGMEQGFGDPAELWKGAVSQHLSLLDAIQPHQR